MSAATDSHDEAGATSAPETSQPSQAGSVCSPREFAVLAVLISIALLKVRKMLWWIPSGDTLAYFQPWMQFIHSHGGWHALKYPFAEYFPSYLYLLAGVSYLGRWMQPIAQIKSIPALFDIVTAVFAYRIVRLLTKHDEQTWWTKNLPVVAFLVTLALPSLLVDGAVWGQCDSIYTSFLLATTYYLMRSAPLRSSVCFGLAMCFKFQAVFLAPVLLVALLRRRYAWWHALVVPAVWIAATIPAVLMGRPFRSIVGLFATQSKLFPDVAMNVANPYQYFHALHISDAVGVYIAAVVSVVVGAVLIRIGLTQRQADKEWWLFFSACSLVVMPYVMPKMHDRYFLPGQVFLVVLSCYRPRFAVAAALLEMALLLPYLNFFINWANLDGLRIALLCSSAAVFLLVRELLRSRDVGSTRRRGLFLQAEENSPVVAEV